MTVARGGTGRSTLTSGYFLRGNGTGAVTMSSIAQVQQALGISGGSGSTGRWVSIPSSNFTTSWTTNLDYIREDRDEYESVVIVPGAINNVPYIAILFECTISVTLTNGEVTSNDYNRIDYECGIGPNAYTGQIVLDLIENRTTVSDEIALSGIISSMTTSINTAGTIAMPTASVSISQRWSSATGNGLQNSVARGTITDIRAWGLTFGNINF